MQSLPTPALPHLTTAVAARYYVPLPRRLVEDLRNSPTAIGIYALIGRVYRVTQDPVPVSPGDLQAIDPSLSYGAATRALQRLAASSYVAVARTRGRKSTYTPTWGAVRGTPHPWELAAPCLGRPRHVVALRLDQRLLDTCLGRVRPHRDHPAIVDRYVSHPLLGLEAIGMYALALAGLSPASEQLRSLGLLDEDGRALPLPDDSTIFALVSQRALCSPEDGVELTPAGWGRTTFTTPAPTPSTREQALFFVPKDQIGHLIAPMIAHPISHGVPEVPSPIASASEMSAPQRRATGSHGLMEHEGKNLSTTMTTTRIGAGGGLGDPAPFSKKATFSAGAARPSAADGHPRDEPATEPESAQLLLGIGVRRSIAQQFRAQPKERVASVIAEARARGDVRNLPAWVVSALRDLPEEPVKVLPVPRVSDKAILLHPGLSPRERQVWLHRFRTADLLDRPAVLARFHQEVAHAVLP